MDDSLPAWAPKNISGRYKQNVPLSHLTWFQTGGPADIVYKPSSPSDLQAFLAQLPDDIPVTVLGAGSNVIIRDGGIRGVVLKLGRGFTGFEITRITQTQAEIEIGAGMLDATIAQMACEAGWGGLSFLSGIPGTMGGALRMNAGAYGRELKDCLISCQAVDRQGRAYDLQAADLRMSYRHCDVPEDWIFTSAKVAVQAQDQTEIAAEIADIRQKRQDSQPVRGRTGGSTFANPAGRKAWELIDAVGGRGYRIGDAQMSEKHCNFMLNLAEAKAEDLEALGEEMRRRVMAEFDIDLRWEIRRIGEP